MSTLSIRIPKYLHERLKKIVATDSTSINQFITSALAEKIAALETESYLEQRSKRASKKKFQQVLDKVPDIAPESHDI